jgi:hypothetical protein
MSISLQCTVVERDSRLRTAETSNEDIRTRSLLSLAAGTLCLIPLGRLARTEKTLEDANEMVTRLHRELQTAGKSETLASCKVAEMESKLSTAEAKYVILCSTGNQFTCHVGSKTQRRLCKTRRMHCPPRATISRTSRLRRNFLPFASTTWRKS